MQRACKECRLVSDDAMCPACGSPTSKNWSGLLTILKPEESELAAAMNIDKPGTYALKVR